MPLPWQVGALPLRTVAAPGLLAGQSLLITADGNEWADETVSWGEAKTARASRKLLGAMAEDPILTENRPPF